MIMAGRNVRQAEDKLTKIGVDYLYQSLRKPNADVAARIRQLRIVRDIDERRYRDQKTQLPYVVCGIFSPAVRKKANFAYTEYFILDIDHVVGKGLDMADVRRRVEADPRVVLCFISPSEDGLKVMFRLAERCYDAMVYSTFYRAFARSFSKQYGLEQVIDGKTCDVSRACFISVDPEAYYNGEAERIDLGSVVPTDSPTEALDLLKDLNKEDAEATAEEPRNVEPDDDTLGKIKDLLNLARRKRSTPPEVDVPKELNVLMTGLTPYLEENGVTLLNVRNISYAKQVRMQVAGKEAMVNIFYGRRGFKVVRLAATGTDVDVTEMLGELIEVYMAENGFVK